ncbi:MAG: F0F1 ATP synthase subunit A [Gemmataceae bacterium]
MAHDPLEHVIDHPLFSGAPVTKYQVLIVAAAALVAALYIPLARKVATGEPVRGPLWNALEALLIFIRDQVARPNIGSGHDHHEFHSDAQEHGEEAREAYLDPQHFLADKYVPFLWTLFLFILACNLLGMVPFLGSPTADISVTLVLAAIVFLVIHVSAVIRLGPGKYVMSFIPHLKGDNLLMSIFLSVLIVPLIAVIEVLGAFIRGAVLAIRLFANIFAGHVALAVILAFAIGANNQFSPGGGVAAVFLGTALSVLELFVAFLQAFVFVLLTSIFLGMQLNPEH